MRPMNERNAGGSRVVVGALCAVSLVSVTACGGGAKGADSPGTCPDGTVLSGSDCVPPSAGSSHSSGDSSSSSSDSPSSGSSGASSPSSDPPASGSSTPYQKDAVEIELKRASRQVKANCGSATDDNGTASGPWGKTSAS